jgi:methylmalonyl-CoA/ethylmalonyl-CoA epimerase
MATDIRVEDENSLSNSFIGDTFQVCVVTSDFRRTLDGFVQMGIGPWSVYTFDPESTKDQTYMGEPAEYSMRLGIAYHCNMMWEVVQPLEGPSIYKDFLAKHGDGMQHVAVTCRDVPWEEKLAAFESRGCRMVQSGNWRGARYAYFDAEHLIGTVVEVIDFPEDFAFPEPEDWVPGPPA